MEPRVYLKIDAALFERLTAYRLPGETDDELFERALGPAEAWAKPLPMRTKPVLAVEHRPVATLAPVGTSGNPTGRHLCKCCTAACRMPWVWRGVVRCACTRVGLAALAR